LHAGLLAFVILVRGCRAKNRGFFSHYFHAGHDPVRLPRSPRFSPQENRHKVEGSQDSTSELVRWAESLADLKRYGALNPNDIWDHVFLAGAYAALDK
jgi:hypothetical protein